MKKQTNRSKRNPRSSPFWVVMNTWRGLHAGAAIYRDETKALRCAARLRRTQRCEPDEVSVVQVREGRFTQAI
jgi:hypothetical protein